MAATRPSPTQHTTLLEGALFIVCQKKTWFVSDLIRRPSKFPSYGDFSQTFVMRDYGPWWRDCPSGRVWRRPLPCPQPSAPRGANFIDTKFEHAVYPFRIHVYETYNPGGLVGVWAGDCRGSWRRFYSCNTKDCQRKLSGYGAVKERANPTSHASSAPRSNRRTSPHDRSDSSSTRLASLTTRRSMPSASSAPSTPSPRRPRWQPCSRQDLCLQSLVAWSQVASMCSHLPRRTSWRPAPTS